MLPGHRQWVMLSCLRQGTMRAGGSLRNRKLEFELNAQACMAEPLQPVSIPHYRGGVSGAGLEMVPSLKHRLVVARQIHGDKAGHHVKLGNQLGLSCFVHQRRFRRPWTGTGTGLDRSVCDQERENLD